MNTETNTPLGITLRSVFLDCRQWRDIAYGQTYTSAALWVNSRIIAYFPLQYGDMELMTMTAEKYLEAVGVLTPEDGHRYLHRRVLAIGADYYESKQWRNRRDCYQEAESLTGEQLVKELNRSFFRAVAL